MVPRSISPFLRLHFRSGDKLRGIIVGYLLLYSSFVIVFFFSLSLDIYISGLLECVPNVVLFVSGTMTWHCVCLLSLPRCMCSVSCVVVLGPHGLFPLYGEESVTSTLLEPQSRFGDKPVKFSSLSPKRDCGSKGITCCVRGGQRGVG